VPVPGRQEQDWVFDTLVVLSKEIVDTIVKHMGTTILILIEKPRCTSVLCVDGVVMLCRRHEEDTVHNANNVLECETLLIGTGEQ
jgi:hypothetical protein